MTTQSKTTVSADGISKNCGVEKIEADRLVLGAAGDSIIHRQGLRQSTRHTEWLLPPSMGAFAMGVFWKTPDSL